MDSLRVVSACILFYSVCGAKLNEELPDYYWRDYAGIVPEDAVPGGLDLNSRQTYIGQGLVNDVGIIPGNIYPGDPNLKVPEHGVKTVDTYLKILCSPNKSAFHWLPANATNFFVKTINKFLIRGGMEHNYLLFLGRIAFQGQQVIGKIVTNSSDFPGLAPMFHVNKDQEVRTDYYEVLVYYENIVDSRMNIPEES